MLNTTQLTVLRDAIAADSTLTAFPNNDDGNFEVAKLLNLEASPAFTVWKTSVTINQVGDNIVGTDLAGLSSLNSTRLQTIVQLSTSGVNPSVPDRRAFFDDVFSGAGGAATRAKLLILWKRLATRFEKLYAVGTGSDAVPANLVIEGSVSAQEVNSARNL